MISFSHTLTGWFTHKQCFHCVFSETKSLMFHSEGLYLLTWSSALPPLIYPPCTCCKNMYARYPVTDKVFSLSSATLRVISGVITLVSGVFLFKRRSDMVCWGNHNTTIPVIDTSRKAFWDGMFLQEEKGERFCFSKWKTNGAGWKIVQGWNGITSFVVPCQPQGHIPEIRISHSRMSILFLRQHILVLSVLP